MTVATLTTYTGAKLRSDAATTNYNFATIAAASGALGESNAATSTNRWLLKWAALSDGTIPRGAIVSAASIFIYANSDLATNARTLRVFRQKRAWNVTQCTWNIYSTGNNWGTAGGFHADDCEQTDCGSKALGAAETLNQYKEIPLTAALVQEIIAGSFANNGFLLKVDTETDDAYRYNCSVANETDLPYLTVTYTLSGAGFFAFASR